MSSTSSSTSPNEPAPRTLRPAPAGAATPATPTPLTPTPAAPALAALAPAVVRRPATYAALQHTVEAAGTDVANRRSALRTFMAAHGRTGADVIGPELRDEFAAALARYKNGLQEGGAELSTVESAASRLRAARRLAAGLDVLEVVGDTFGVVLRAACEASPLTIEEIARRGGLDVSTLDTWRGCARAPSEAMRGAIERLEGVLGLAPGALNALVPARRPPSAAVGFAKVVQDALKAAGLSIRAAAARAGVRAATIQKWASGHHLPGAVSRTRDLPPFERALGLEDGALLAHLGPVPARSLPYVEAFTPEQAGEFARLVAYKTDRTEHRKDRRPLEFWRVRADRAEPPSARRFRTMLQAYYGYLALPADAADPLLRGLGRERAAASLADLADAEALLEFLRFRAARARHDAVLRGIEAEAHRAALRLAPRASGEGTGTPASPPVVFPVGGPTQRLAVEPTGFNAWTYTTIGAVRSLLRAGTGYLWQAHGVGAAVVRAFPALAPDGVVTEAARAAWRARVEAADNELAEFQQHLVDAKLLAPTRDHVRIERILGMDRPILALAHLRRRARLAWEQATRFSRNPRRRASRLRDYVLLSLLCVTPLRLSHWEIMTYRPDGSGNLRRVTDPARAHRGHYELYFPAESFKALAGFRQEPYVAEVPAALTPAIDAYLLEARGALYGATACDYVFRPERKSPNATRPLEDAPVQIDEIVVNATRRLIPEFAPLGMRTHAFRHIIATHLVKNYPVDGEARAADALHNTVAMIRKHYGHLRGLDRTRRALLIIDAEFDRIEGAGALAPPAPHGSTAA